MNPDLSKKVSNKIESLCTSGCSDINQLLEKAGNGEVLTDLEGFSPTEVQQIIHELGEIMAVYEGKE